MKGKLLSKHPITDDLDLISRRALMGSLLGAGAGGVYGALAPGKHYEKKTDEEGNVIGEKEVHNNRLGAALALALGGGMLGGVGGGTVGASQSNLRQSSDLPFAGDAAAAWLKRIRQQILNR